MSWQLSLSGPALEPQESRTLRGPIANADGRPDYRGLILDHLNEIRADPAPMTNGPTLRWT